ncbi:hypothetical protein [Parasphingopyxis sp.]|uniref:hypothetical protein n=1 Tax=Parasphingopyxis sp. TaxID=1920299 RepID=UPI002613CDF4|nr:hypothetical protein [Parasphingopyxis sp.]
MIDRIFLSAKQAAVLLCTPFLAAVFYAAPASAQSASPGDNLVVCGNTNWGGLNQNRTLAMRQKLSNIANFGPGGTFSESTFTFVIVGTPTAANLAANNCNIWFSGYDSGPAYTVLQTFVNNGGFVIGGCDNSFFDAVCNGLGVTVTNYSNIGGGYTSAIPINPLTCDGGSENLLLDLTTAGGASSYFTTGSVLARYSDANAFPLAITNSTSAPTYLLTGDIDMFTTNNPNVSTGSAIVTDQDKFIANVFKLAADVVTGVLAENGAPSCDNISVLIAVDDTASVGSGTVGITILNILANDRWNGDPVTSSDVTISVAPGSTVPTQLNFDIPTGDISLNAGSAPGTYSFDYTICLVSDPAVCRTATVQITVTPAPSISVLKSSSIFMPTAGGSGFAIPGEDVIYSILVENSGPGAVDNDTVFIVDAFPEELTFFNGDLDTGGPEVFTSTDPVVFEDGGSGLTLNYATDVAYSDQPTPPDMFTDCNYTPAAGYDNNVTYICINPKGAFAAGAPVSWFRVFLRGRIE